MRGQNRKTKSSKSRNSLTILHSDPLQYESVLYCPILVYLFQKSLMRSMCRSIIRLKKRFQKLAFPVQKAWDLLHFYRFSTSTSKTQSKTSLPKNLLVCILYIPNVIWRLTRLFKWHLPFGKWHLSSIERSLPFLYLSLILDFSYFMLSN